LTPEEKTEEIRKLNKSLKQELENKNPDDQYIAYLKLELEKLKWLKNVGCVLQKCQNGHTISNILNVQLH